MLFSYNNAMVKKKIQGHPLAKFLPSYRACEELSRRVGCSPSHLMNIKNGHKRPSLALANRIADETGLAMKAFVSTE